MIAAAAAVPEGHVARGMKEEDLVEVERADLVNRRRSVEEEEGGGSLIPLVGVIQEMFKIVTG